METTDARKGPPTAPLFPRPYYDGRVGERSGIVGTGAVRMPWVAPCGRPSILFYLFCS